MTAAAEVLTELQARGVRVRAVGDRIVYAPREALDDDPTLRARVVAAKPDLLRMLALDDGFAMREVRGFPARYLGALPLPTTLVLDVPDVDGPVTVATHARSGPAMFDAAEWLAIVDAAESNRAWPADLAAWCERKRSDRGWRLTAAEALGPVRAEPPTGWTVGRVLGRLGAELRVIAIEGDRQ